MKIYVKDYGWSGASIIVTDDYQKAYDHFSGGPERLARLQEGNYLHEKHSAHSPNPWTAQIREYLTGSFMDDVEVFDIVEGLIVTTLGDN